MIKLKTSEGEPVWIQPDKVVLVAAVKSKQESGPPVVMLGLTMVYLAGAPPVVVHGSPEEVAQLIRDPYGRSVLTA